MANLYWKGKNAIQIDKDVIVPDGVLPGTINPKDLKEWKEKGLVSEFSSAELRKNEAKENDVDALKAEIEELKNSGDKKLKRENKEMKSEIKALKAEIEAFNTPMEDLQ